MTKTGLNQEPPEDRPMSSQLPIQLDTNYMEPHLINQVLMTLNILKRKYGGNAVIRFSYKKRTVKLNVYKAHRK